jgi:uncharacterized HAD superfamily protein/hypoxanthine phosphoribosyltransferase
MLEYRSVQDLNELIAANLDKFDPDLNLIVGNPRSGMLPATLISLYLNLPLTDLNGYLKGSPPACGTRFRDKHESQEAADAESPHRKVLIVDDSLVSGSEMSAVKDKVRQANIVGDRIQYCAIYIHPDRQSHVDIWLESSRSLVFEWNIMTHPILTQTCMEIDGVLCRHPLPQENDDGPKYKEFIESVEPLYQPAYKFGWVVSSRLEKYRWATAEWLKKNHIEYDYLIMLNIPLDKERTADGTHAQFKADVYAETDSVLFIEPSDILAPRVARLSRKPVFCTKTKKMYYHTSPDAIKRRKANFHLFKEKVVTELPKALTQKFKALMAKKQL